MTTFEELNIEIEGRFKILMNVIIFYKNCKYLNNPKTIEEKDFVEQNLFIRKTRYAFWVISVLELSKLYGRKNDHFTFKKLIEKLLLDHELSAWKDSLSLEKIKDWEKSINDQETSQIIQNLYKLRDNYYAHSDKSPKESISLITPEYEQMENLINLGKNIIFEIKSKVFDIHQLFDIPGIENANNIINILLEYDEIKMKEFL